MSQGNNVQLTCASCGQPYLIQAVYQNSPHQCPLCGAMAGAQPMQQPGMPLQPQAPVAPGMHDPAMQNPPGYPAYQNPQQPGAAYQQTPTKWTKERIVFIVRCVVGVIAVVAIVWTLIYIMNRDTNITVELGDSSEMGKGGILNAGTFDAKPGTTFKAKFKIKQKDGEDFQFKMSRADELGATISEEGQFVWEIGEDVEPGNVEFRFVIHDRKKPIFVEFVKLKFNIQ